MDTPRLSTADYDMNAPRLLATDLEMETPRPSAAALPSPSLDSHTPGRVPAPHAVPSIPKLSQHREVGTSSSGPPSSTSDSISEGSRDPNVAANRPSAPVPGNSQRRHKARRVKHAMRRASFNLSPNPPPNLDPLPPINSMAELENHLKALFISEEDDAASDLDVEPPSRPGTPDSDDDEARPRYPEGELAEDVSKGNLPIPWESKSDLSQYPKMFLEDWMDDLSSLPWGADRPNPYDRTPVPYPDGGSAMVAIISQLPNGRQLPAYNKKRSSSFNPGGLGSV